MINRLIIGVTCLLITSSLFGQKNPQYAELKPLTAFELQQLASIPEYVPPVSDAATVLPTSVDNSTQPYFRTLFTQSGLECGQASSVGLTTTYELNLARNLPANVPQNQLATYFTYNFLNGGSDAGVSYYESWEIIRRLGNPSVQDYGGLSAGGSARWMSGYDKYLNAMHNRITELYTIRTTDVTGLNTLREWIYNHNNTTSIGGCANFYIQFKSPDGQLPAGTPEAGKWVIVTWGGSSNHAVTVVGYNDSIRWDYNNDGQYTNNIDINGDGVVNLKDWEKGGVKIANTYGSVTNWGDQGFSYVMYKTLADNLGQGGIWNQSVNIVKVKPDVTPKLTYKLTIKHSSRNKIKLMAGVSQNPTATEPDQLLNLPVFDFQGGDKYMQGGTTEADKTIEIGLDVTPLLSHINPAQAAKFFFMLQENDPNNAATGQIVSYTLMDYNGAPLVVNCSSSNVPIVENGLTTLTITHTPQFSKPIIANTSLPPATIYQPYSYQLSATGGTPAYRWKFKYDYDETAVPTSFPSTVGTAVSLTNGTSSGFAEITLPFEFPFYGKKYTKVYPHVDGYLMFESSIMPWTFLIYEKTLLKNSRNISPYMSKPLTMFPSEGDGIWYEVTPNYAIFRWKEGMYGSGPATDLNFAVKIFPNGTIEFYYGSIVSNSWVGWNAGFSDGDGINYHVAAITDSLAQPTANSMFRFTTLPIASEMSLSEEGLLTGTPSNQYVNEPMKFYVEDNNKIFHTKTLNFSTKGINIEYSIQSGADTIPEYGETAHLTATLTNIGTTIYTNVVLKMEESDPYVLMLDSTQNFGQLNPGQSVSIADAISFSISPTIPDNHIINTVSKAIATQETFIRNVPITAFAPNLQTGEVAILDGNNNILMPGENASLNVTIHNNGGSVANTINGVLTTIDPFLIINQGTTNIASINNYSSQVAQFQVTAAANCPVGHVTMALLHVTAGYGYSSIDTVYFTIGTDIEDFETGNMLKYPWQFTGSGSWSATPLGPYEGTYCSQSPTIGDNEFAIMYLNMNVLNDSEISFYRKVSSENNYDYLTFYIDGNEMEKWSGQQSWAKFTYPVLAGNHTFKWKYSKDVNTVAGSDKAWVDYITWPTNDLNLLIANAGPDTSICAPNFITNGQAINATDVSWSTSGDGTFLNYSSLAATYTPGINDLAAGSATLTLHATKSFASISDEMVLMLGQTPTAYAGPNATTCGASSYALSQATATNQASILWTSQGDGTFNNTTVQNPVYTPGTADIANGSVTLSMQAIGQVGCGNQTDDMLLTIADGVDANAGEDQSISFGTSTQLNGTATGGTGVLFIQWQPAEKLVNAAVLNPTTINLTETTIFTLTTTDPITQCTDFDETTVFVDASVLGVSALADPDAICLNQSTQLNATAGGGSGSYTYAWVSDPIGFTSSLQNPIVWPLVNTTYTVTVNDGSSTAQSSVSVRVDTAVGQAEQPIGPTLVNPENTPISLYNTAGSPNAIDYSWVLAPSTAGTLIPAGDHCQITWDQAFEGYATLQVSGINACGIGQASEELSIFVSTTVGIPNLQSPSHSLAWPNPANTVLYIQPNIASASTARLFNATGLKVGEYELDATEHIYLIDVSHLSQGIYILTINSNAHTSTHKITIAR